MNNNFLNLDIYSKRIGFFFNNKEKIGTYFGLFLTIMYILISFIFFLIYCAFIIKRVNIKAYGLTLYSKEVPSIDINPNFIYFAFGLENHKTSTRFIDESIYYPKITFYDMTKIKGQFTETEKIELEYETCQEENFGENYSNLFSDGELNNSYCIKDYNLTLRGGYKYDKMSYLRIKLYPCKNSTQNNYSCKPQNIIDSYLDGGYFSMLIKDIGVDPSNYSSPIIPTLQNLHTTINKSMFRDFVIYYGITEIKTDIGLFSEEIETERYLQFKTEDETFYLRDEEKYYNESSMISIDFRLDELIYIQKRSYTKMPEVFSIIGGYMQLINTIFTLLSILTNGLIPELKILNSIFNFNLKEKKMTLRINSLKKHLSSGKLRRSIYFPSDTILSKKNFHQNLNKNILSGLDINNKQDSNNISKNTLIGNDHNDNNSSSQIKIINYKKYNSLYNLKEKKKPIEKIKNTSFNDTKFSFLNQNKNRFSNVINNIKFNNSYKYSLNEFYPKLFAKDKNEYEKIIKEYKDHISFNTFDYYCFKNCSKKNKEIELFKIGLSLYKKRMDIKNVFTLLLFIEKNTLQNGDFYQ